MTPEVQGSELLLTRGQSGVSLESAGEHTAAVGLGYIWAIFALVGLLELSDVNTIIANTLLLFEQAGKKINKKKGHRFFLFNSLTVLS